ncbi:MAG: hypothetical protein KDA89_06615 [Planctomycetaceae bacterium]|nr:hypothetical protein [Planctomycetaceae bacterium]
MKDLLDESSDLLLTAEYDYVSGNNPANSDLRVIQFVLKVFNKQRRILQSVTREVNDSGDIARILGTSVAPPDSKKVEERNREVEKSFDQPSFDVKDGSLILAKNNAHYAVQILRKRNGTGNAEAVTPKSVNGQPFVDLSVNDTFEIVLFSFETRCDASVDVTIDGLSVINEFNEDGLQYEGYMVPRSSSGQPGTHHIPGWLKTTKSSQGNVFQFVINELGKGAATARKSRSSRGVINVQFFEAAPPGQDLPARSFGEVGTGKPVDVDYDVIQLQRRETPIVNIAVRYSNAQ